MSRAQAESVIKNIIREIAQECASKGQAVSETLVAFMVKAVVLEPVNEFNVNRALTKDDVQKLIRLCVDRLIASRSPSLDTVKMQVYFDMNYTSRSDFLEEHRRVLESRLQPVIREITDSRSRTREELESLYRKIVSAILLRSGLGSPVDIAVVREATAALQSVFPQTELGTFMSLTKRDKERQLSELTMIVTGIRLFNKECGKGGEGIDDLPAILNEAVPATTHNVDSDIQHSLSSIHVYTAILEMMHANDKPVEGISMNTMKEALINGRQHEAFLRIILTDIISSAQHVEMLENELSSRMEQLKSTVQSKTAVPTAQVYPQFIHLANIWSGFQDEMVLLSVLSNILSNLEPFAQGHRELFTEEILAPFTQNIKVKTDEERIAESTEKDDKRGLIKEFPNCDWLYPETTKNFNKLLLQFKGYCAWTLVMCDRLLLPGNPAIGVIRYHEKHYVFSDRQKAYEFGENPEWFINQATEAAKRSPELIQLLELHTQFATITPYTQRGSMIEKPLVKCDSGTQTDTHFMDAHWDKNYEWNEWELRRKAIKLTNLRKRLTKSMQTNLSNFKRDNITQTYPPKDQRTQTKTDNYTNVPKPSVYIAGLRGSGLNNPTEMTRMDLTIDVEEQMFLSHKVHVTKSYEGLETVEGEDEEQ